MIQWLRNIFTLDLSPTHRVFGLDVMRAIGILLVIEAHAYHLIVDYFPAQFLFIPLLDKVCFSFILSGFLIGRSIIKLYERTDYSIAHIRVFWYRRWIRTIPLYLIVITTLVIIRYLFTTVGFEFPWRSYLFVQNFYQPEEDPYYFYPEGWSLAVEEWFYFLFPVCVVLGHILLARYMSKRGLLLSIIISIIAVSTTLRYHRALHTPFLDMHSWNILIRKIVLLRLDTLMYGVLAAYVSYYYQGFWVAYRRHLFYLGLVAMGITLALYPYYLVHNFWLKSFYISQVAIIVTLLVPMFDSMKQGRGLWLWWATYLSKISFCIYLLNRTPILKTMMQLAPSHSLGMSVVEYLLYLVILLAAATLLHKYIEQPILRLRPAVK